MTDHAASPGSDAGGAEQPCPACAEPVGAKAIRCPQCGERLRTLDRPVDEHRMAGCLGPILAVVGAPPVALVLLLLVAEGPRVFVQEPAFLVVAAVGLLVFGGGLTLSNRFSQTHTTGERFGGIRLASLYVIVALILGAVSCLLIPDLTHQHGHRKFGNETAAIGSLKTISVAQALFREGDKEGDELLDYGSLTELASAGTTGLIDPILGGGTKMGYYFQATYSRVTSEFLWYAVAEPAVPQTTGERYFAVNQEGVTFYSTTAPFTLNAVDCTIPAGATPVGR